MTTTLPVKTTSKVTTTTNTNTTNTTTNNNKGSLTETGRMASISSLKALFMEPTNGLLSFAPIELPYSLDHLVSGTIPSSLNIYKSSDKPLYCPLVGNLRHNGMDGIEHVMIIKKNCKNDKMILVLFSLIKRYILPWSSLTIYGFREVGDFGFIEFIPTSIPISSLEGGAKSIAEYLSSFPVKPKEQKNNFIITLASYSLLTWLFGIGDRHLDNILLLGNGKIVHVDYSYLWGSDPKPFKAEMKISNEMIDYLSCSDGIACFIGEVRRNYLALRRESSVLLKVVEFLFQDARCIAYVRDRLMVGVGDGVAVKYLDGVIKDSITSYLPSVMDTIHKWVMYFRE